MSNILKVRSDFIRVAHAFCFGVTGVFDSLIAKDKLGEAARSIYVEPHATGEGVRIVSTDGCALCVQWDRKGYVDRPRMISGLTGSAVLSFSGSVLDDRWIEARGTDDVYLTIKDKPDLKLECVSAYKAKQNGDAGDGTAFPRFQHMVVEAANLHHLTRGFPGTLNCAYLALIARLYEDGLQNVRSVRIYCHADDITLPVILHFPWRDYTTVILAPTKDVPEMWKDVLTDPAIREFPMPLSDDDDDL